MVSEAYTVPAESTRSLVRTLRVEREASGGVKLSGEALLPRDTKVTLYLHRGGQAVAVSLDGKGDYSGAETRVGPEGHFSSPSLFRVHTTTPEGHPESASPLKPGMYQVEILSYLNSAWQPASVLRDVGEGGANLPKHLLVPDDPEFPLAARHLQDKRLVEVPTISPEVEAIEAVKNARLSTPESGLSADPVKGVIALFESAYAKTDPDMLRSTGWSATKGADGRWVVTMHYLDSRRTREAHWEFIPESRRVRYLDPEAKNFSWSPSE